MHAVSVYSAQVGQQSQPLVQHALALCDQTSPPSISVLLWTLAMSTVASYGEVTLGGTSAYVQPSAGLLSAAALTRRAHGIVISTLPPVISIEDGIISISVPG